MSEISKPNTKGQFKDVVRSAVYGTGILGELVFLAGVVMHEADQYSLNQFQKQNQLAASTPFVLDQIESKEDNLERDLKIVSLGIGLAASALAIETKKLVVNLETKLLGY